MERRDFTEVYNAIVVPEPVRSADASDPSFIQTERQFFQEVQNSLQLEMRTLSYYFRYSSNMLVPRVSGGEVRSADDGLRVFRLRGGQAIASALYLRGDAVGQIALYSKYPLRPDTIDIIYDLQKLERIEFGMD